MNDVIHYLRQNQDRFLEELSEFVAIPSVSAQSHHSKDLSRAADWLVAHCRAIGLKGQEAQDGWQPGNHSEHSTKQGQW